MSVRKFLSALGIFGLLTLLAASGAGVEAAPPPGPHGAPEPSMLGIHWSKGHAPPFGGGGSDPHLVFHNGPVMANGTEVTPIFWGSSWPSLAGDKISGLADFYGHVGGTSYFATNEGNGGNNPFVSTSVTYTGHLMDTSAAPRRAPKTSAVLAEVQSMVDSGNIVPTQNGYYAVYVDTKRGGAGYCAWHSWGYVTYNGSSVLVQFGFFFNLDGDSGCDPQDPSSTHSQGLEALVNVSGHELSEVATDPNGSAWYDKSGYENADKCAWIFDGYVTLSDNSSWKIQDNWTNAAYDANQGATKVGCINSE